MQVLQPLLQSPVAAEKQCVAAAAGLSEVAAALAALAKQADSQSTAEETPQLARTIAATLAVAVAPQPPAGGSSAGAAAASASGAAAAEVQLHLDHAVDRVLAAARALMPTAAAAGEVQPAAGAFEPAPPLLLAAVLDALKSPAASPPQVAALQGFLAALAPELAVSQPQLLAAMAGSLLRTAEALAAETGAPENAGSPAAAADGGSGGKAPPAGGGGAATPQLQPVLQALMQVGAALPGPTSVAAPQKAVVSQPPAEPLAKEEREGGDGAEAAAPELKRLDSHALAEDSDDDDAAAADAARAQPSNGSDAAAGDGAAAADDAVRAASGEWPDDFEGGDDDEQWVGAEADAAPGEAGQNGSAVAAGAGDASPQQQQPAGPHAAALAAARHRSLEVGCKPPFDTILPSHVSR